MAAQEVLNMVFDPEGDYYTEKIKPLSIDTTMLSVGAKSMQFGIEGVVFQANYEAAKNRVVYSAGSLVHYAILSGTDPRVWSVSSGDVTLLTDAAYYVYAKCERVGLGATIIFSTDKITVESDATYYHFLIGIINSVDNNVRSFALMYGFTTVNGRFIKTGRVQSADGLTYFDLDAGEIVGKINFKDGLISSMIELGDGVAAVTSGLQGDPAVNTAIWTGGTYQNALDNIAKVIFRKDGSGQLAGGKIFWDLLGKLNVGNFTIENGAIVGKDTNGAERVRFSIEDIPAISTMANTYVVASDEFTGSSFFVASSLWDSDGGFWYTQIVSGNTSITLQKTVVIPYATQVKVDDPTVNITGINFSDETASKSVTIKNSLGTTVATGNVNTNLSISTAGTYTVYLQIDVSVVIDEGYEDVTVNYAVSNSYVRYIESVEKSFIGKDGLFSYFSSSEYMHFKKTQGLKVKGATDLPGVLVAGSMSSAGSVTKEWGAKYTSGSRSTTGVYKIDHSIGHTNYSVQVTSLTSARLAYIGSKNNNYVLINMTNTSGTLTDTAFDFLIIGSN